MLNEKELNAWQSAAVAIVTLICGLILGRFLLQDALLYLFSPEYPRRDHDTNNDDEGTTSPEEVNETDAVFADGLTNHETNGTDAATALSTNGHSSSNDEASALLDERDYLKILRELASNVDHAKMNENLLKFLTQATIMIVSVSASTIQGKNLTNEELSRVMEACQMAMKLSEKKRTVLSYVESRMTFIAPNLLIIVDSLTAAKLMGMADGLTNLSKMPPRDISLMDVHKKVFGGFSSITAMPHAEAIFYSKTVQDCPPNLRVCVARLAACKATLAARVDSFHESIKGEQEKYLLTEIERILKKLQEPRLVKAIKPLAPPIVLGRKNRGGRRFKKMKERVGMTQLRTQANQMKFGEIEEDAYQDAICFLTGLIEKSGSGKIRAAQVDSKTKANISQKLQKTLQHQNNIYGGTTIVYNRKQISKTASCVDFIPRQVWKLLIQMLLKQIKQELKVKNIFKCIWIF